MLKRRKSHACPICTRRKSDEKELKRLIARRSGMVREDERDDLEEQIVILQREWNACRLTRTHRHAALRHFAAH